MSDKQHVGFSDKQRVGFADQFHSIECALRHNGADCTCGYDERKIAQELEWLRQNMRKKAKGQPKSAIKELIYAALSVETSELCRKAEEEHDALVYTIKSAEYLLEAAAKGEQVFLSAQQWLALYGDKK